MDINGTKVSAPVVISSLTLIAATAFHIGYFQRFGIEFISFISTGDLVSFFAFIFPFALIAWTIIYFSALDAIVRYVNFKDSKLFRYIDWTFNWGPLGYIVLFVGPFSLLILSVAYFIGIGLFFDILLLSLFIFQFALWISISQDQVTENQGLTNSCAFFVVLSIVLLFNKVGHMYSEYFAGTDCLIVSSAVEREALFYRSVGSGILIKIDDVVSYIPNSNISEISCKI